MRNQTTDLTFVEDGLTYTETIRQAYSNCIFSAGIVEGHPVDTLYIMLERNGKRDMLLLLRPDEAAALAWCLTGTLWTHEISKME